MTEAQTEDAIPMTDEASAQAAINAERESWEQSVGRLLGALTAGAGKLKRLGMELPTGAGDPVAELRWLRRVGEELGLRHDVVNAVNYKARQLKNQVDFTFQKIEGVAQDFFRTVQLAITDLIASGARDPDNPIVARVDFKGQYFIWFKVPQELPVGAIVPASGAVGGPWKALAPDHIARRTIAEKECFTHTGEPWLILGAPDIGQMSQRHFPKAYYPLDDVVRLTRIYREGQLETLEARKRAYVNENIATYGFDFNTPQFASAEAEARHLARERDRELTELRQRVKDLEEARADQNQE